MTSKMKKLGDALANAPVFTDGDWVETKDQDPDGAVRLIQLADVGDGTYINKSARFLTPEKASELRCTYLEPGDVLVARMPDPLGRSCIFPGDERRSVTVVDVCIIRPDPEEIDNRFLMRCINSPGCRHEINRKSTGTTRERISRGNLATIEIPLPALHEQKRIAAILDAADELRTNRRESLAQLDALLQSTFLEMFGDPVTNPKGWDTEKFSDVGVFISGGTPSKARNDFWEGDTPWVSPKDMKVDRITDAIDHVSESAFSETNLKLLKPGHLLIVVRGMILAHSFPTAINTVAVAINQDMKAIQPSEKFDVLFLKSCVDSMKRQILALVSTAGHGTKRLDADALQEVHVPCPPKKLQERFSKLVTDVLSQTGKCRAQLSELDTLFASLQSRAFRGEL